MRALPLGRYSHGHEDRFDQLQVDVAGVAVGVEVGAREGGGEERHAELVRRGVELIDVAVLRFAQLRLAHDGAEVRGKVVAGMRGIEYQRRHHGRILE